MAPSTSVRSPRLATSLVNSSPKAQRLAAIALFALALLALAAGVARAHGKARGKQIAKLDALLAPEKNAGTMVLSPARVAEISKALKVDTRGLLRLLVHSAASFARPGITGTHVGAAALGKSGAVYLGGNFEVANTSSGNTVHAEQFAIINALNHGERGVVELAIDRAPCGHCRQFLLEPRNGGPKLKVHVYSKRSTTLARLVPAFYQSSRALNGGLQHAARDLELSRKPAKRFNGLANHALGHAKSSYALYTSSPAGAALQLKDGRVFRGGSWEAAGLNPSVSPLRSALVSLIAAGGDPKDITKAVLVEGRNAPATHRAGFRDMIRSLAPKAQHRVYFHREPRAQSTRPRTRTRTGTRTRTRSRSRSTH